MHCVQALWGPVAPQVETTALAVGDHHQQACFSGAQDGSIVSWHYDASGSNTGASSASKALQPVALLQQHQHPVVAMLAGLHDTAGRGYLLSLDCEGWMCLWDLSSWSCVDMQRVAPLPSGVQPHIATLEDPEQVCLIIPATPRQQRQHWQKKQSDQQQQQHHVQNLQNPAAVAAAHAPMMLVLHWRTLSLVAAPLVAPLGVLIHTTSMRHTMTADVAMDINSRQQQADQVDGVVAVLAIQTAPALAPTAADTVVLAVTSSGYLFGGSCAGNKLPQAWHHPAAVGGSTAPLITSCMRSSSSSSGYGSSTAAGLQLHVLLVQHNCWRLLACSSFSSSTGMPNQWQQLAQQQQQLYSLTSQPQYSCGSPFADAQPHSAFDRSAADSLLAGAVEDLEGYDASSGPNRVRFSRVDSDMSTASVGSVSSVNAEQDAYSAAAVEDNAEQQQQQHSSLQDPSYPGSSNPAANNGPIARGHRISSTQQQQDSSGSSTAAAGDNSSPCTAATAVMTAAVSGVRWRRATARAKQQRLLGGLLVLRQVDSSQQPSNSSTSDAAPLLYDVTVVLWTRTGLQEVWGVGQQHHTPAQQQQQAQREAQPGRAQPVLLQLVQLQPWLPATLPGAQTPSSSANHVTVLAALDPWQGNQYAVMVQQQPKQQGQHQQQHGMLDEERYLAVHQQQQRRQGCHLHLCQLLPHVCSYHNHHHNQHCRDEQHQQQRMMLSHFRGSLKVPWSRQHLYSSGSNSNSSTYPLHSASLHHQQHQQVEFPGLEPVARAQPGQQQGGSTPPGVLVSSRKRPAMDNAGGSQPSDPACSGTQETTHLQDDSGSTAESLSLLGGRCKHPRLEGGRDKESRQHHHQQHMLAVQRAAVLQDLQQQKVTHMLLLASDSTCATHIAVILESGTLLFYDLATYCIPGAAWHPDCCHVGGGHTGRVSSTLQLQFKCPPNDLIAADTPAAAAAGVSAVAAGSGLKVSGFSTDSSRMVPLETAAAAAAVPSTPTSPGSFGSSSGFTPQPHSSSPYTPSQTRFASAAGTASSSAGADGGVDVCCSIRPVCGGLIPLLLTGGVDGSVRAWDCRTQQLGHSWMTVHPHTAPVVSFVLAPASSRLPWSSCVLSVDKAGVVALSCLAAGTTHITLHGWGLGPPAQLAWSTTRGVLAAGGWDADGLWRVSVWDTYTGQLDRQLSGPPAHMIMAQLTQELTSISRMHKREQQQQQQKLATAAGALHEASLLSSNRMGMDPPPAAAAQRGDTVLSRSGSGVSAVFASRMEVYDPSCLAGPMRVLRSDNSRSDVILIDINIDLLLEQLEAYTKQQQQRSSRRRHQQLEVGYRSSTAEGGSSSRPLSQRGSLDMSAYVNSSSSAGVDQGAGPTLMSPALSPAAAAGVPLTPGSRGLSRASSSASQSQLLLNAVTAAAAASSGGSGHRSHQQQQQHPHGAVAQAIQALCLLHRWGVDPHGDTQLLQLLLDLGYASVAPLAAARQQPQQTGITLSPSSSSSSTSICESPAGPDSPVQVTDAPVSSATGTSAIPQQQQQQQQQQQWLLDTLLHDPSSESGSTSSLLACPCLSQEALVSGTGAAVMGLPAPGWQQQQQTSGAAAAAAEAAAARCCAPSGVLLYASSSSLSSRLLSMVSISKWLLSAAATTQPAAAASNEAATGLIHLYTARLVEVMRQAASIRAAAASATPGAAVVGSRGPGQGSTSLSPAKQQQQQQLVKRNGSGKAVLVDLLLISSICCSQSSSSLLSDAAHSLLAALVQPAPPATYSVSAAAAAGFNPTASLQQQQQQQGQGRVTGKSMQGNLSSAVFTSPGAAAAASCWPPAVLQLALLHQRQQQGSAPQALLTLQDLDCWLPLLVLSATAAIAAPDQVPPELLAAVSASLLDVLFGAAPGAASVTAAGLLCGVLRSGGWHCWRPYLGKPAYIIQRLCQLVDRLSAVGHYSDHSRATAALLENSQHTAAATAEVNIHHHNFSTDGNRGSPAEAAFGTTSSSSSSSTQSCNILAEQPAAIADPRVLLQHSHKSQQHHHHHSEGGLFISSSMLHPTAHEGAGISSSSRSSSSTPVSLQSAAAAAGQRQLLGQQPLAAGAQFGHGSRSPQQPQQQQQHTHTTLQQQHAVLVPAGRAAVVAWLRAVVDVFASVALVDPATVLNEVSHKLADPSADVSSSLPLVMSGLARLCQHTPHRHVLLPHLGYTAALAVQALEPNRPTLRSSMMQPVTTLVRELTASFPQVSYHSGTLQLAVGSTRPLGLQQKDAEGSTSAGGDGSSGGGGIMHQSVYAGTDGVLMVPGEMLNAAAVAIFDMNGGSKRKVLLLPVLLPLQQQHPSMPQQLQVHASSKANNAASVAGEPGNSTPTSVQHQQHQLPSVLPGGIASLWSAAQGVESGISSAQQQHLWGSSSSSSMSSSAAGGGDGLAGTCISSSGQNSGAAVVAANGSAGGPLSTSASATSQPTKVYAPSSGVRTMLASNTMTRAEAAMVQHWFGGQEGETATAAAGAGKTGPLAAAAAPAHMPAACNGIISHQSSIFPNSISGSLWGIWLCHERRSSYYPSATAAGQPLMTVDDVASGVAAVAFNPAGDAVVAFIESCQCLVAWKLQSSWTQKFSSLGSRQPSTHNPCAYIPVPPAAVMQQVHLGAVSPRGGEQQCVHAQHYSAGGAHSSSQPRHLGQQLRRHLDDGSHSKVVMGEWCSWQVIWAMPGVIDLVCQGRVCASMEVHL